MTVPSNITTATDAVSYILNNPGLSTADLTQLVNQMNVTIPGAKTTLLYSGAIGSQPTSGGGLGGAESLASWRVAEGIGLASNGEVATIGQTDVAALLNDVQFKDAFLQSVGNDDAEYKRLYEGVSPSGESRIYNDSLWDQASRNLAASVSGEVSTLTAFADDSRVFAQTELQALLNNTNVTKIDGIDRADLNLMFDGLKFAGATDSEALQGVREAISAASYARSYNLQYGQHVDGAMLLTTEGFAQVNVPDGFFNPSLDITIHDVPNGASTIGYLADLIGSPTSAQMAALQRGTELLNNYGGYLDKLGVAGDILGAGYAAAIATVQAVNGDTDSAVQTIADWMVDFGSGTLGAIAGGALAAKLAAPLLLAGPPGVVALGIITAMGALGGAVAGSELGQYMQGLVQDILESFSDEFWLALNDMSDDVFTMSISDAFQSALEALHSGFGPAIALGDPLVVDLDNDGYELIASGVSNVYFDFNGDSIGERTGWVAPDDGFLALDKNSNGVIDDVSELFGNLSMTGFDELATHDETVNGGNADGVINSSDAVFSDLLIWQDLNSNGVTDAGELKTLTDWGITQISLTTTDVDRIIAGNELAREAHFADGEAVDKRIGEVFFNIDFFDNDLVSGAGTVFGTDEELLALPLSRGYGEVVSLQKAMETDLVLRGLVEDFADYTVTSTSAQALKDSVTDILFRWTGADQVALDPNSPLNTREVFAMEKLFAEDFDDLQGGRALTGRMIAGVEAAWKQLQEIFLARFLLQGPLKALVPDAHYDFVNDTMRLNASLAEIFTAFEASGWKSESMSELLYGILSVSGAIDPNIPVPNEAYILFGDYENSWIFPSPESVAGNLITINGTSSADTLDGWAGGDVIYGGDGNDTISTPSSSVSGWIVNGVNQTTTYYAENYHHFMYGGGGADTLTGAYGWNHLFGGDGNDRLISTANDNAATIHGGAGADIITSAGADDLIFGGLGDDSINAGNGNDQLYGGAGNDTLNGGQGNNLLHGGAGDDVLSTSGGLSYLEDTEGNNEFIVSNSEVTIVGGAGNDTVSASGFIGHSTIQLGDGLNVFDRSGSTSASGTVSIETGSDADFIRYYASASTVQSGEGNDTIYAGTGIDSIESGAGDDYVHASHGNNVVHGEAGHDTLIAGSGNDLIYGGDGNDSISASHGDDTLYGGAGDDTIDAGSGNNVMVDMEGNNVLIGYGQLSVTAGDGDDSLSITSTMTGHSVIDLGQGQNTISNSSTTNYQYATTEVYAGDEGDSITLRGAISTIIGGLGDDYIYSSEGADSLNGGGGNDNINARAGNNTVYGGDGNDTITAASGNDLIYGGDGNDSISASHGDDTLYGGAGDDTIDAGSGNNVIVDMEGNNVLTGYGQLSVTAGDGDDSLSITSTMTGHSVIDLGQGQNTISNSSTTNYQYATAEVYAGDEGDSITLRGAISTIIGGLGDDYIYSSEGADSLNGGGGNDTIYARGGNNTVYGGDGSDTITAGNGSDIIDGGSGVDLLSGGSGDDIFVFSNLLDSTVSGQDIITDFAQGYDQIDLTGLGFTGIQSGAASGTMLGFSVVNGDTVIEADGSDFSFILEGNISLINDDFVF